MKKVLVMLVAATFLTGCGYTIKDAQKIENIIMNSENGTVHIDETNAYLDINRDGMISPADYVAVMNELAGD